MARFAEPYMVVIDAVHLGELRDQKKLPDPPSAPWAEGDKPHWESLDLDEYANEVLNLRVCRSFRADLQHKLRMIVRANGGYGRGGINRTAQRIGVRRMALYLWLTGQTTPRNRHNFETIDSAYIEAIETLTAERLKTKARSAKQVAAHKRKKAAQCAPL